MIFDMNHIATRNFSPKFCCYKVTLKEGKICISIDLFRNPWLKFSENDLYSEFFLKKNNWFSENSN